MVIYGYTNIYSIIKIITTISQIIISKWQYTNPNLMSRKEIASLGWFYITCVVLTFKSKNNFYELHITCENKCCRNENLICI